MGQTERPAASPAARATLFTIAGRLVRSVLGGGLHCAGDLPQLTAFFTSAPILTSSRYLRERIAESL